MKVIRLVKKILKNLRNEEGFALPTALVLLLVGGLLVVPSISLAYTSITANRAADEADKSQYAADAGIEYAYWQIKNNTNLQLPATGQQISLPFTDTVNGRTPTITISNQNGTTFRITSTATGSSGSSVTVISDVDLTFSGGVGLFDNALAGLSGNIEFGGNTEVTANSPGGADIYAGGSPGNIGLAGGCYVDGDASAVGTITLAGGATITGQQHQGAPPLQPPPGIDTWVQNHKSQAFTDVTWYTTPTISSPVNANIIHTVSDRYRSGGLSITGNASSSVTFTQPVWVTGNLTISSSGTVVFSQPVRVDGYISITSDNNVTFESTVYVGSYFATEQNATINVGDTMYIVGNISMASNHNAAFKKKYITGESPIIAEGNISLTGNATNHTNDFRSLPIVTSVNGNINLFGSSGSGARWVEAVLYTIHGSLSLSNNGLLCGCAVATESLTTGNSSRIVYLTGIGGRGDLPGDGGGGVESTVSSMTPRTYSIQ